MYISGFDGIFIYIGRHWNILCIHLMLLMLSTILNEIFCLPVEDDASEYDYLDYNSKEQESLGLEKSKIPETIICSTANDSKVPNKPCVFPFKFKDVVYEGCPTYLKVRYYNNR